MRSTFTTTMIILFAIGVAVSGASELDENASFSGPFGGAGGQSQMAQTFAISESGHLNSIEAYVPTAGGPSCEFTWYLRDAATFDPGSPDIDALPILLSGTAWTDVPAGGIYDSAPSLLFDGQNISVDADDMLALHIVRDCSLVWVSGTATRPGERFKWDGEAWVPASVAEREHGRNVYVTPLVATVERTWGTLKAQYR